MRKLNHEVYYSDRFGLEDIKFLKSRAESNVRKRCRLCLHNSEKDVLHEMFIVHMKGNYIPPHSHMNSDESIMVLEGEGMLVLYSKSGVADDYVYLNSDPHLGVSYYRVDTGQIHSLFVFSQYFLFKETTLGPFCRDNMYVPDWAVSESDVTGVNSKLNEDEKIFVQLAYNMGVPHDSAV